jgi:hypothetical protein
MHAVKKNHELPEKKWPNDKEHYHVKGNAGLARSQAKWKINICITNVLPTPLDWNSFSRTIRDTKGYWRKVDEKHLTIPWREGMEFGVVRYL